MYELELFAGAGGGILGKNLLGHTTVGAVEIEPFCRKVLLERQKELCCPMFPIWDDIKSFTIRNNECSAYIEWLQSIAKELCISGGFPCQDISASGRGKGIKGKKSSLWLEMVRIISEIRPAQVFVENSPMLASRGLEEILSALATLGYDAKWGVLGAGHLNYPIKRDRLWILGQYRAYHGKMDVSGREETLSLEQLIREPSQQLSLTDADPARLMTNGFACRESDGLADEMDKVKAIGNGQVPSVVALAYLMLSGKLTN